MVAEGGDWEVAADAGGGGGVVQKDNFVGAEAELGLQGGYQLGEAANLDGGWHGMVEVADDADTDAGGLD